MSGAVRGSARGSIESEIAVRATPAEFARMIASEIATWSKVVKAGNIRLD